MVRPAFFKDQQQPVNKTAHVALSKIKHLVNVGSDVNSGYRAIAVGLIDNMRQNPRANHLVFSKLIAEYKKSYALPALGLGLQTPQERGEQLVQVISRSPKDMAKFVNNLAVVLRKIALKEMQDHSKTYIGGFDYSTAKFNENALLPQAQGPLNEYAIQALKAALGLSINVRYVEPNAELFAQSTPEAKQLPGTIDIQLEENNYKALVHEAALFQQVALEPMQAIEPIVLAQEKVLELNDIRRNLSNHYNTVENRLITMLNCGEISKAILLDAYIANGFSKNNQGGMVTSYCGSQKLFEKLLKNTSTVYPLQRNQLNNRHDTRVAYELIKGLARLVSLGVVNEDKIYEQLESHGSRRNLSVQMK